MKQLMNVNYAVESFIADDCTNYVLRVMMDPRQAPIVLGVFSNAVDVVQSIADFNKELSTKTKQQNS